MKIYVYSHKIGLARREAEKIAKERGGKIIFQDGIFIIHAPAGESAPSDYKNMGSPDTPGLQNTAEVET